ncbi:MAG TPA: GTPase Era [Gaiellaceae bacterium]|nr:GTPase Era [Gaiellaceae bacterium]
MRSGFVAVAGRPNVGKSTIVNALAGGKVAIVSDKPQTTRRRISAVVDGGLEGEPYQLVLVDLPGFQRPRDALTERMQRTVNEALADVDGFLFVLAADEAIGAGDRFIAERVYAAGPPVVVALNKVDRVDPARIAEQIVTAAALGDFHALHPVSGLTGDGLEPLRADLAGLLPEGPRYFEEGQTTDLPLEARIAEIVREKALQLTREEVPHALSVEVDELDLAAGRVTAHVWVETESQKGIVVGKGGGMIRTIGTRARPEIESLLGRSVFLDLRVKVRPKWRRDENALERLGI